MKNISTSPTIQRENKKINFFNRILPIILTFTAIGILFISSLLLSSCENKDQRTQKDYSEKIENGETLKIGVIQFLKHPSLDNCFSGVEEGLKELEKEGIKYEIDRKTGSDASGINDCENFAKIMVAKNYDLIIAIATPAAEAAYTAALDTDIPVIFCAVNDPVGSKLVNSNTTPGDLCSGSSDVLDLKAQLNLIKSYQPNVKKIGVLYTSSEVNSLSNLKKFREIAEKENIEIVASGVQNSSEIPVAAKTLCGKVDCINNFTDNNVVNNLSVLLSAAEEANIPVYGSEIEQVKAGCLASVSINYQSLGKETGKMAKDVILGSDIKTMSVITITDALPCENEEVAKRLGLSKK